MVLITGAAGGQGRTHAMRFAREGARLVLTDIPIEGADNPRLTELTTQLRADGHDVVEVIADTRDKPAMVAAVDEAVTRWGRIDVVVANAGISARKRGHEIDEHDWQEMLGTNATGTWNTCMAAVPHMVKARGGVITVVGSIAAHRGMAELAHYSAAKHAAQGIVKSLALEYGGDGIRVNSVSPTRVNTPMLHQPSIVRRMLPDLGNPTIDDLKAHLARTHALPVPWIETEDVTAAVCWISSYEARFVTGIDLPVDAGALLV